MPISGGGSGGGAGGQTTISDSTLSGAAASFDIQSIPATYAHLRLLLYLRSDRAGATVDTPALRINNDSGTNYAFQTVQGSAAATAASETLLTQSSMSIGQCPGATATASYWGQIELLIVNYAGTTGFKTITVSSQSAAGSATGNLVTRVTGGIWVSATAISRLTVISFNGANFIAGSRATLYGISAT